MQQRKKERDREIKRVKQHILSHVAHDSNIGLLGHPQQPSPHIHVFYICNNEWRETPVPYSMMSLLLRTFFQTPASQHTHSAGTSEDENPHSRFLNVTVTVSSLGSFGQRNRPQPSSRSGNNNTSQQEHSHYRRNRGPF